MKKYEVIVEDHKGEELADLLQNLPYVKGVKEKKMVDPFTSVSEASLAEDWLSEEDDELQKMYGQ